MSDTGTERAEAALRSALAAVKGDLDEAREAKTQIDQQISRLEQVVAELQELIGLERDAGGAMRTEGQRKERRTDAVERILRSAAEPLTVVELAERLAAEGRRDDRKSISATLSYLNKQGRAMPAGNSRWRAGSP